MYAIVRAGGKEYRVSKGDLIRLEKIDGKIGDEVDLNEVLMIHRDEEVTIGSPVIPNVSVKAEIVDQVKGKKVLIFKMKKRKNYRRLRGHRQHYTYVRVKEITVAA